jgi:SAM-dependent methyltransferase
MPRYRPLNCGEWEIRMLGFGVMPGYWSPPAPVANVPILLRQGVSWMSMTPNEFESQGIGIAFARGHVLIMGLGLGWAAAACAALDRVTAVTVVERDPGVLALHAALDIFTQLPADDRAKLRFIHGDALTFVMETSVDVLLADIWQPFVSDGRVDEVRRMHANTGAATIHFWGQELEIARHAVAAGRALDSAGIAATVAETGLPLAGTDSPDYPAKLEAAARRWMRGRWLEGSATPW